MVIKKHFTGGNIDFRTKWALSFRKSYIAGELSYSSLQEVLRIRSEVSDSK